MRRAATVVLAGVLLSLIVGLFHAGGPANDHPTIFAAYASSAPWTLVHLGQFAGMLLIVVGLVALFGALNPQPRGWIGQLGVGLSVVSLALYGVLQAVDGVALKHAVDAWVRAPEAEKIARFASAEAVRWTEWGVRSYHSFVFGLALLAFAAMLVETADVPKPIGYLMGLSGLAYVAQGWVVGSEGFSATNDVPILAGIVLVLAWSIWLCVASWRKVV